MITGRNETNQIYHVVFQEKHVDLTNVRTHCRVESNSDDHFLVGARLK